MRVLVYGNCKLIMNTWITFLRRIIDSQLRLYALVMAVESPRTRIVSEWLFEPEICALPDFAPRTSQGQRFTRKSPLDPTG